MSIYSRRVWVQGQATIGGEGPACCGGRGGRARMARAGAFPARRAAHPHLPGPRPAGAPSLE